MFWKYIFIMSETVIIWNGNKLKQMIKGVTYKPYLKTNASKLVENTKAFELTIIKELGKLTP
jgi:hypothetical protein